MERPHDIALEVLEAIQKKQFAKWWEDRLPSTIEKFPWKEREILPDKPYKPLGIIEIKGISEAGKSTGLRCLTNNPIKGYRQIIRPELIVEDLMGGLGRDYNLHELKSFMRILQGDAHRALFWNMIKNISFSQGLKQIVNEMRKDAVNEKNGLPPKLIIERGPHDVLTTSYLAAKLTEGTKDITRSEGPAIIGEERYLKPDFGKRLLETFSLGLSFGEAVNAVVLYYISREEQISRRKSR